MLNVIFSVVLTKLYRISRIRNSTTLGGGTYNSFFFSTIFIEWGVVRMQTVIFFANST